MNNKNIIDRDSLKQVGEKVDLHTMLKRRRVPLERYLAGNNINSLQDLEKLEEQYVLSELFVREVKEYLEKRASDVTTRTRNALVEVALDKQEVDEDDEDEATVHKPGKRKKP